MGLILLSRGLHVEKASVDKLLCIEVICEYLSQTLRANKGLMRRFLLHVGLCMRSGFGKYGVENVLFHMTATLENFFRKGGVEIVLRIFRKGFPC